MIFLGQVQFLDHPGCSEWQGACLELLASDRHLKVSAWEAERLRRALRYLGLAPARARPRARLRRWRRGREAATATALLRAAGRWAAGPVAEAVRRESQRLQFVEVEEELLVEEVVEVKELVEVEGLVLCKVGRGV